LTAINKAEYKALNVSEIYLPLFQGTEGSYKGEPIQLELLPGSKPYFSKPYSIPKAYEEVMKGEIDHLERIGLLTRVQSAEWATPTFVILKKNGTVRVIMDYGCGFPS
jgi:hypothetical protein